MKRSQRTLKPLKMPTIFEETVGEKNTSPGYKAVKTAHQIQKSIKERVERARQRYRRIDRNEPRFKVYVPAPVQRKSVIHNTQYSEQPAYVQKPQGLITPEDCYQGEVAPVPQAYQYLPAPVQQHSVFHNTKYDSGNFQQYVEQEETAPASQSCSTNYMPNPHMLTPSPEPVNQPVVPFVAPQSIPVADKKDTCRRNRAQIQLQRYHAMTPEQKHQYNQRRTEQCRNRREENASILAEAAKPNATPEALAKAEKVLARKKMCQERNERMKYNKMMDAQRKKENGTN